MENVEPSTVFNSYNYSISEIEQYRILIMPVIGDLNRKIQGVSSSFLVIRCDLHYISKTGV